MRRWPGVQAALRDEDEATEVTMQSTDKADEKLVKHMEARAQ